MAVANAAPANTRRILDANYIVTRALPNATTVNSNTIDLVQAVPYPVTERVIVSLSTTAATGANNKNINISLQDSADTNTSNFTNISELAVPLIQLTDANNAGYSASGEYQVLLPPAVKRYIRCTLVGEANGGNAADGTLTLELKF